MPAYDRQACRHAPFTRYKKCTAEMSPKQWVISLVSPAGGLPLRCAIIGCPLCVHTCRGSTAVALLCIYYVAPLSTLLQVLRERDSSSIYWPLSLMNLVNAVLWTVYGLVSRALAHTVCCAVPCCGRVGWPAPFLNYNQCVHMQRSAQ